MNEYKLKLKTVAPGAIFGLFPFSSTSIEVIKAKSAGEAINIVQKEFDKQLKKHELGGRAMLEVLDIEQMITSKERD